MACTSSEEVVTDTFPDRVEIKSITGIELPDDVEVIGNTKLKPDEHIKKTSLRVSKEECRRFAKIYRLKPVNDSMTPLFESTLLDSVYRLIPAEDRKNYLHKYGRRYSDPEDYRSGIEKNKAGVVVARFNGFSVLAVI